MGNRIRKLFIQFIKYSLVGGTAFVVDAGVLWIFESFTNHLTVSVALGFTAGIIVNYALSKLFIFKEKKKHGSLELLAYAIIGIIGLGFTEILMYLFTDKLNLYFLFSKMITAAIVLVWNFLARKFLLYR